MHRKLIALTAVTASLMVPAASFAQSSTAPQGSTSAASSTARVGNHPKIDFAAIAKELDLTDYNMENCAAITRLMEAAGLPEPYRRLTDKPDHVPQWCSKHWLKAGERKGGGKRRRAS